MQEGGANREGIEFQKSWPVLKVWPLGELSSFIRPEVNKHIYSLLCLNILKIVWGMGSQLNQLMWI